MHRDLKIQGGCANPSAKLVNFNKKKDMLCLQGFWCICKTVMDSDCWPGASDEDPGLHSYPLVDILVSTDFYKAGA